MLARGNPAILAMSWSGAVAQSGASPSRPASQPAATPSAEVGRPLLELVEILKEDNEHPILSRKGGFIHAFPITWRGEYVLVATHYEGLLHTFKRDMTTGKLTHIDAFSFDDAKDMSILDFVWAGGRLYFHGARATRRAIRTRAGCGGWRSMRPARSRRGERQDSGSPPAWSAAATARISTCCWASRRRSSAIGWPTTARAGEG